MRDVEEGGNTALQLCKAPTRGKVPIKVPIDVPIAFPMMLVRAGIPLLGLGFQHLFHTDALKFYSLDTSVVYS